MEIAELRDELEKAKQASLVDMQTIAQRYNDLIERFGVQIDLNLHFQTSRAMSQEHHRHFAVDITTDLRF